jgi:hypothetical protein
VEKKIWTVAGFDKNSLESKSSFGVGACVLVERNVSDGIFGKEKAKQSTVCSMDGSERPEFAFKACSRGCGEKRVKK